MTISKNTIAKISVGVLLIVIIGVLVNGLMGPEPEKKFPELYILGEDHTANPDTYPSVFFVEERKKIYVGLKNRLGHIEFFKVEMKIWNSTPGEPPFNTPTIHSFIIALGENETWESPIWITFTLKNGEELKININNQTTPIKLSSKKLRFIFELYVYNETTKSFDFYRSSEHKPVWLQFWFELK